MIRCETTTNSASTCTTMTSTATLASSVVIMLALMSRLSITTGSVNVAQTSDQQVADRLNTEDQFRSFLRKSRVRTQTCADFRKCQ